MKNGTSNEITFASILFRAIRVIIVLGVCIGAAMGLIALKKAPEKQEIVVSPPGVRVVIAHPETKVMAVEAFGTVKPRKLVKIAVEVPGRIVFLHPSFTEGGTVKKGDVLIRLDTRSFELDSKTGLTRIRQAKADIRNLKQDMTNLENDLVLSKKNVALAQKERDRVKALTKNNFASKNTLDKVEQQYLQARIGLQNVENRLSSAQTLVEVKQAALELAQTDYRRAQLVLDKSMIKAPFDGFVLDKYAEEEEYVNPGQVIGSIYQKDSLDVDVRIPMEKMKWIESLFTNGHMPQAKVSIANTDGGKHHEWDAKVVRIKARVDERTRTLPMTIEIVSPVENKNGILGLKPGAFVKCTILGMRIDNIYVLPRHLMKPGDILYTVDGNRLRIKKAEILRKFEEQVFIKSGLKPGEQIVSSPLPGAVNGMEVTVMTNGDES